jgi:TonB family protein
MELRHKAYYNQIWQIFAEAWVLMESVRAEKLLAVVAIGINGAGKIAKVQFERRSGDRFFDESVERALAKVGQLPPPPETDPDGFLWVGLRFTPTGVQ